MMALCLRCRHWSVLPVFAIVVCYRGNVLCEIVQGCVGSQLSLRCPEMKVIQITAVVLGDSDCSGTSCCIKDSDCTHNVNEVHRRFVHRTCDNKQSCTVDVIKAGIDCGLLGSWSNNDFERITYDCEDDPQSSTTATFSMTESTEDILHTEETTLEKETENDDTTSSTDFQTKGPGSGRNVNGHDESVTHEDRSDNSLTFPVVMTIVCLLVLIVIVAVVVMMRRKRRPKVSAAVQMTDFDSSDRSEAIYANENQTMSPNDGNGFPIYDNDETKTSTNKGAKASETYEVPNNAVDRLADGAGSRPTEDLIVLESIEPAYQEPINRSDASSFPRVDREPECAHKTDTKVNKPSKNAIAFDLPRKVEAKDKLNTSDGFPNPTYVTMSPVIPESFYANELALSPSCSVASKALSTGGTETENPYCEMRSPTMRFKDYGSVTVVENDLYSH